MSTNIKYTYGVRYYIKTLIWLRLHRDKTVLNRLGLVIHWLGFLAGVATAVYLFINPVEDRIYVAEARIPYVTYESNWLQTACLFLVLLVVATCIGWAFNFILAGHKSPLPWVANKEAI